MLSTGAPLERVPWVPGNPSILGKAKYNKEVFRKPSLNFNDSQKIQNSGTRQLEFLMEPLTLISLIISQANEEIKVLNLEVDDEEPIVDVAPKGNSLFSEVEDRRHIAEEKLKKVQTKLQEFKALYERKAIELNKLRMQNVHLMNMVETFVDFDKSGN